MKSFSSSMSQIYALLTLAFSLEARSPRTAKFEEIVHGFDDQFILSIDKAEGAIIATLLLENLVEVRPIVATAILSGSYCGRRVPAGDGGLLEQARDVIGRVGSTRQVIGRAGPVKAPSIGAIKADVEAMLASFSPQTVQTVITSLIAEINKAAQGLAKSATAEIQAENVALAQEVDMLWWNMGGWSDVLERPRRDIALVTAGIVAGYELGSFVGTPPGPYGVYGILRHSLADEFDKKTTLKNAVNKLGDDAAALAREIPEVVYSLFPITAAIAQFAKEGKHAWDGLAAAIGDVFEVEVSYYELAVQAYREAILIGYGGLN
jgi:hypothetical protein